MTSHSRWLTIWALLLTALVVSHLTQVDALFGGSSYQRKAQAYGKRGGDLENVKRFFPLYLQHGPIELFKKLKQYQVMQGREMLQNLRKTRHTTRSSHRHRRLRPTLNYFVQR